jgi:hypothetical protein
MQMKNVDGVGRLSKFWIFFVWHNPNDFLLRLVSIDKTWLFLYDPETKQQSMGWRHSGSPRLQNSEYKNLLERFLPRYFGIKTVSFPMIIFQRAKISMQSVAHLCWCK